MHFDFNSNMCETGVRDFHVNIFMACSGVFLSRESDKKFYDHFTEFGCLAKFFCHSRGAEHFIEY